MRELFKFIPAFFHGWRRKVGCVALILACLFGSVWVRSIGRSYTLVSVVLDHSVPLDDQVSHFAFVHEGGIEWTSERLGAWKDYRTWYIPHRSLVLPLCIVSAYLLLWKPGKNVGMRSGKVEPNPA